MRCKVIVKIPKVVQKIPVLNNLEYKIDKSKLKKGRFFGTLKEKKVFRKFSTSTLTLTLTT